jgi:glucosylceramidase
LDEGNGQNEGRRTIEGSKKWKILFNLGQLFCAFFEEYAKRGVQFWALTVENEPSAGLIKWYSFQAMYFSAAMQRLKFDEMKG